MKTSVILTLPELHDFLDAVYERDDDPSSGTCLMFARWHEARGEGPDMVFEYSPEAEGTVRLLIPMRDGPEIFPLRVTVGEPVICNHAIEAFQMRRICAGVWAMAPSLNIPGVIHAFVVLHGVPEPAPWEQLVILVKAF
jgi:hypothetical protein